MLPYVKITKHNRDADSVKKSFSCTERWTVCPNKKQRKTGGKVSVQPPKSTKSFGPKHSVHFSRRTSRHMKIRERKGPSQVVIQRTDLHERSLRAPKFEDRSEKDTLKQGRCARRDLWEMAKKYSHAQ